MPDLRVVELPPDLVKRCRDYGQSMVDAYQSGRNRGSRALSSHGAENNVALQIQGRSAEAGFCLSFGLDPEDELNWSGRPDDGWDLGWDGHLYDVKGTGWNSKFLIWPVNKNPIFEAEKWDRIVLVKVRLPLCFIRGWLTKDEFRARRAEAPRGHRLTAGTWYVHEDDLRHTVEMHEWRGFLPIGHPQFLSLCDLDNLRKNANV